MARALAILCLCLICLAGLSSQFLHPLTKHHFASGPKNKHFLNIAFIGERGSGKSSALGRILYELAPKPEYDSILAEAEDAGRGDFKYSWLVDTSSDEREAGSSETSHRVYFEIDHFKISVKDTPGELEADTIAAVATSNIVVIFVSADTFGDISEERWMQWEAVLIAYRIKQIIFVINRSYGDFGLFNRVCDKLQKVIIKKTGLLLYRAEEIVYIPVDTVTGENILTLAGAGQKLSWYTGKTLIDAIKNLSPSKASLESNLRFVVDRAEILNMRESVAYGFPLYGSVLSDMGFVVCPQMTYPASKQLYSVDGKQIAEIDNRNYGSIQLAGISAGNVKHVSKGSIISNARDNPCKSVFNAEVYIELLKIEDLRISRYNTIVMHVHNAAYEMTVGTIYAILDPRTKKEVESASKEGHGLTYAKGGMGVKLFVDPNQPATFENDKEFEGLGNFIVTKKGEVIGFGYTITVYYKGNRI